MDKYWARSWESWVVTMALKEHIPFGLVEGRWEDHEVPEGIKEIFALNIAQGVSHDPNEPQFPHP